MLQLEQSLHGVCVLLVSSSAFVVSLYSAVAHNLGSESKKATGIPMFMAIGQCGSVLGSHIFPSTEGPRYMCVEFW